MTNQVKDFIEENAQLLENEDFYEFYQKAYKSFEHEIDLIGELTGVFLDSGINPLDYLKEIPNGFLSGQSFIKTYSIPGHITSIGSEAFQDCKNLTSVIIPDSVTSIGSGAFSECGFEHMTLPNSISLIDSYAFHACGNLKRITIWNSVTSIGDYAFCFCWNLTRITYKGTIAEWKNIVKGECWNKYIQSCIIKCVDGEINIDESDI